MKWYICSIQKQTSFDNWESTVWFTGFHCTILSNANDLKRITCFSHHMIFFRNDLVIRVFEYGLCFSRNIMFDMFINQYHYIFPIQNTWNLLNISDNEFNCFIINMDVWHSSTLSNIKVDFNIRNGINAKPSLGLVHIRMYCFISVQMKEDVLSVKWCCIMIKKSNNIKRSEYISMLQEYIQLFQLNA